jgi:hypothetical protein
MTSKEALGISVNRHPEPEADLLAKARRIQRRCSRRPLDPQSPRHTQAQGCRSLTHAPLDRLPATYHDLGYNEPDARFDIEQTRFHDLLNDRPKSRGSRLSSTATLATALIAESVNIKSVPSKRTTFLNCWINEFFGVRKIWEDHRGPGRLRRKHRQPLKQFGNEPKRYKVFRLHIPQKPISRHLVIFRQLIERKTAPAELLGDECPLDRQRLRRR